MAPEYVCHDLMVFLRNLRKLLLLMIKTWIVRPRDCPRYTSIKRTNFCYFSQTKNYQLVVTPTPPTRSLQEVPMKFICRSLLALVATPVAVLCCLHTEGETTSGTGNLVYAFSNDNGQTTCTNDWGSRIDQDGHWSLTCLPGYVYAFTKDGSKHWYSNGINAYSWTVSATTGGHAISWVDWRFGCN